MKQPISKYNPLLQYKWGDNCDAWNLVAEGQLSVKQEKMPAATSEKLHYHNKAIQFFYILQGTAEFEIEGEKIIVKAGEGLTIAAGKKHKIINNSAGDLEFLVCSHPPTQEDRINCEL